MGHQNYAKIAAHKQLRCYRVQTITVFTILLTSERRKQYSRSLSYTKICSFGKIQLNIQ